MDDKGEVKCIKFSIGNKILAVQRTPKSVVRPNFKLHIYASCTGIVLHAFSIFLSIDVLKCIVLKCVQWHILFRLIAHFISGPTILVFHDLYYCYCTELMSLPLQDFINFIPDFPHIEFSHECKVLQQALVTVSTLQTVQL